jgi:hypothetical protein
MPGGGRWRSCKCLPPRRDTRSCWPGRGRPPGIAGLSGRWKGPGITGWAWPVTWPVRVSGIDASRHAGKRRAGKSDAIDAVRAARELLARPHPAQMRADGDREALRLLMIDRDNTIQSCKTARTALAAILVTAPAPLRERLRHLPRDRRAKECAALTCPPDADRQTRVLHQSLIRLGQRIATLGIGSYAHFPGHENLYRGGMLVLFAAVVVDLLAPVLALARRSSARPTAGGPPNSQSSGSAVAATRHRARPRAGQGTRGRPHPVITARPPPGLGHSLLNSRSASRWRWPLPTAPRARCARRPDGGGSSGERF